ncbi:MAG: type II toxin-antitoxin system VapC family toxin [Candidatus Aenigmarchaeota archaeon]|nr:type II toxin-antitoxin system VapC family toxin [Candidatus Aenigmarchaeota archaeon]
MIYLDANFFIFANFDTGEKGNNARRLYKEIVDGKKAVTSALGLDEVMWVLVKNKKAEMLREIIYEIYSTPNLSVKEVASTIPLKALDMIEKHRMSPRDAFHIAVMESSDIKEIVSDDSDFDKVEWISRIKL